MRKGDFFGLPGIEGSLSWLVLKLALLVECVGGGQENLLDISSICCQFDAIIYFYAKNC